MVMAVMTLSFYASIAEKLLKCTLMNTLKKPLNATKQWLNNVNITQRGIMTSLSGKKAEAFVEWLTGAKHYLPPLMKIGEAQELFERKLKEDEEFKNQKNTAN